MNTADSITLSAEQAAFIQGNVTIYAAAIGADLTPQITRAAGCRVDANNRQVTIFVSAARASAMLAAVRNHRTLAAVFSQPGNHKAIQLKTSNADMVGLQRDDATLISHYYERMIAHISPFGFAPDMLRAFFSIPISDAVALQFTVTSAFDQTPGPNAGAALRMPL
jgi:biotin carboxylase